MTSERPKKILEMKVTENKISNFFPVPKIYNSDDMYH